MLLSYNDHTCIISSYDYCIDSVYFHPLPENHKNILEVHQIMKYNNLSLIKKAPAIYRCLTINYKLFLGGTRTTRQAIAVPTQQDSIPPLCGGAYTQKVYHENLRFYRPQTQGRRHARRRDRAGGLDHSAGYIGSTIEGASLRWQRGSFFLLLPKHLSVSYR